MHMESAFENLSKERFLFGFRFDGDKPPWWLKAAGAEGAQVLMSSRGIGSGCGRRNGTVTGSGRRSVTGSARRRRFVTICGVRVRWGGVSAFTAGSY